MERKLQPYYNHKEGEVKLLVSVPLSSKEKKHAEAYVCLVPEYYNARVNDGKLEFEYPFLGEIDVYKWAQAADEYIKDLRSLMDEHHKQIKYICNGKHRVVVKHGNVKCRLQWEWQLISSPFYFAKATIKLPQWLQQCAECLANWLDIEAIRAVLEVHAEPAGVDVVCYAREARKDFHKRFSKIVQKTVLQAITCGFRPMCHENTKFVFNIDSKKYVSTWTVYGGDCMRFIIRIPQSFVPMRETFYTRFSRHLQPVLRGAASIYREGHKLILNISRDLLGYVLQVEPQQTSDVLVQRIYEALQKTICDMLELQKQLSLLQINEYTPTSHKSVGKERVSTDR